jgi:nucleoside-diphosphate-sugar epimerase
MVRQLILGAGLVGVELSRVLLSAGDDVSVATRSGTPVPGTRPLSLDAADASALTAAARDTATIFVCTNPPYDQWTSLWPPIGAAVLRAASATGAKIVLMGNLYGYGSVDSPMTADLPLNATETKGRVRARLWADLLAAHQEGSVQAAEVRASDYFGPGAGATAHLGDRFFGPVAAGRTAYVIGDPAQPHSWAYLPDIARTLAAVAASDAAMGRPWIVPASSDDSRQRIASLVNARTGRTGRVRGIPATILRGAGIFSGQLREIAASSYQFLRPFRSDGTETEQRLDVRATDFATALNATLAALPGR